MQTNHAKVQDIYNDLDDLKAWDYTWGLAKRCGFDSAEAFWEANPLVGSSVYPADYGLAKVEKGQTYYGKVANVELVITKVTKKSISARSTEDGIVREYIPETFFDYYELL